MHELTREQEARIASMAIDSPSIRVFPQDDGSVQVDADGQCSRLIDADGNVTSVQPPHAYVALPVKMLRDLLGDGPVDDALAQVRDRQYPDHALASVLGDAVRARIDDLTHHEITETKA